MDDDFIAKYFGKYGSIDSGFVPNPERDFPNHEFQQMFQDMENMMRIFNPGNFQIIESSQFPQSPSIDEPNNNQALRDSYLKPEKPLNNHPETNNQFNQHRSEFFSTPSLFERFFEFPDLNQSKLPNNTRFEEDLDEKIARDGFDKVLREDLLKKDSDSQRERMPNQGLFFGQSSSFKRIQRPDGSIEEIKSQKNSDGNEEKTITRIIGEKSHTIIEKRNKNGNIEETEEYFTNIDHDKLDDFNHLWNKPANGSITDHPSNRNLYNTPRKEVAVQMPKENTSIISKLFSWFK